MERVGGGVGRHRGGPGRDPRRVIDVHAHDVPLSRKIPSLFRHLGGSLPGDAPLTQPGEAAKLPELIEDMDRAGVVASLVVLHEETGEFFHLGAQHPGRLYGLAYFDSLTPREGLDRVRALCDEHPMQVVGVTTAFPYFHQDPRLRDFAPLYEYCLERGLPVQFHMGGDPTTTLLSRPMALAVLATTYPRLKIVCLHPGERWHDEMPDLLKRFPNVFLAVGGLQFDEREGDREHRTLFRLMRATGGRKLMFGSGWMGRDARYFQRVDAVRRLPWWQRATVSWRTALRVFGTQLLGHRKLETGNWRP
jgi:hypothetical protein